mgnify:CR=1 FL=1
MKNRRNSRSKAWDAFIDHLMDFRAHDANERTDHRFWRVVAEGLAGLALAVAGVAVYFALDAYIGGR